MVSKQQSKDSGAENEVLCKGKLVFMWQCGVCRCKSLLEHNSPLGTQTPHNERPSLFVDNNVLRLHTHIQLTDCFSSMLLSWLATELKKTKKPLKSARELQHQ